MAIRRSVRRAATWTAGALATLLVIAAALVAVGDRLVDRPAVRAEMQERLSAALHGQVQWEALDVRLLPRPHGELRKVRIEIPGLVTATADQIDIYLRLWPLLIGRPEIASLTLRRPQLHVSAAAKPAAAPAGAKPPPADFVTAYRDIAGPVARALQRFAPDTVVELTDAALEVELPRAGTLALREVNASARGGDGSFALELRCASDFWQRLQLNATIDYASLSAKLGARLDEADLGRTLAVVERGAPVLKEIGRFEGRVSATARASIDQDWRADVSLVRSTASVRLKWLPWPLSVDAGKVALSADRIGLAALRGKLGDSTFSDAAGQIELDAPARLSAVSGKANLRVEQWLPWLAQKLPLQFVKAGSGNVEATVQNLAMRFDRPAAIALDITAVPRQLSASLSMLPGAVSLDGGTARISATEIAFQKAAVALLDAKAVVSGKVGMRQPQAELALADGVVGEQLVRWAMQQGGVPSRLEPKTPLRVAAPRVAWSPQAAVAVEGQVIVDGGPQVTLDLAWRPRQLDLRRVAVKDAQSDATFRLNASGEKVLLHFAGRLSGRSIAAVLRQAPSDSGTAQGDFRVAADRAQPARSTADGSLRLEGLDLTWLAGHRAIVERADLQARGSLLRVVESRLDWGNQPFALSGEMRSSPRGPVIDARLESSGVQVEALLPASPAARPAAEREMKIWPLPVSGRLAVNMGFVRYADYRIEPFAGDLMLEADRARIEVKQANLCGIAFPLEAEAAEAGYSIAAHISMKEQPIDKLLGCMSHGHLDITGNADLRAELQTQGRAEELQRNLAGKVEADLRKGRVNRFALIGNILSIRELAAVRDVTQTGFPYKSLTAKGQFAKGEFVLEEGFFDSDAARIAANGTVNLADNQLKLSVLVALFTSVDRVMGAIPILGDVLGGSITALPVSVTGDMRDPRVVPLGPHAVSDRLLGIFERALKVPGKLVAPSPGAKPPAKP